MKKNLRTIAIITLATLLLGACSSQENKAAAPLRIGWIDWPGHYPLRLAISKGFFQELGLEIEVIPYSTQAEVNAAVASGMVDGGTMVLNDTLLDDIAEVAQTIMITDNSDGADLVVSSTPIVTSADLIGKRIGTRRGSFGEFFVREMLAQKGISPTDVRFVNIDPEDVPSVLFSQIDVGHTYTNTKISSSSWQQVIFTSKDTPGLIVDVVAMRKNTLEARPDDIRHFVAAWFKAVTYWKQNPEESAKLIAEAIKVEPSTITQDGVKLFDLNDNLLAFRPGSDSISVYFTARKALKFLTDSGFVTNPVNINEALNPSFLK